jgi:NAD+ synthase (glutamine-hydrolysing)
MRAMLTAIRCGKGDLDANLASHLQVVGEAKVADCDLVLFPEMSLTGSVDPATHPERLITLSHPAVGELAAESAASAIAICFGIAERDPGGEPRITQVFAAGGEITAIQRKRHLGDGEDAFTVGAGLAVAELAGARIGMAICAESGYDGPFDTAAAAGVRLLLFPAAPGLYGRRTTEESWRAGHAWWEGCGLADAQRHARRLGLWVALAGQAGSTSDEDFPGLAALVGPTGDVVARLPDWQPGLLTVDIPL